MSLVDSLLSWPVPGERCERKSECGIDDGLRCGLGLLGPLVLRGQMLEVEDGVTGLPQGQGHARREAAPQKHGPRGLAGQLPDGAADVRPAALSGGQP